MNARVPPQAFANRKVTTVFRSGNSQAVRIPKEFQFDGKEVTIERRGNEVILKPRYRTIGEMLRSLPPATPEEIAIVEAAVASRKPLPPDRDVDLSDQPGDSKQPSKRQSTRNR